MAALSSASSSLLTLLSILFMNDISRRVVINNEEAFSAAADNFWAKYISLTSNGCFISSSYFADTLLIAVTVSDTSVETAFFFLGIFGNFSNDSFLEIPFILLLLYKYILL